MLKETQSILKVGRINVGPPAAPANDSVQYIRAQSAGCSLRSLQDEVFDLQEIRSLAFYSPWAILFN
jgi:hypothetical protein